MANPLSASHIRRSYACWAKAVSRALVASTLFMFAMVFVARSRTERANLLPKLKPGQTLSYHVTYRSNKLVKTESPAVSASQPENANTEVHALLRLEIVDLQAQSQGVAIHARTHFQTLNSDPNFKAPNLGAPSPPGSDGESVEFTLLPDGDLENVKGLDALLPEQQQAWQEWLSRFSLAASLPEPTLKIAQKWKSEAPENSPSPIAGLRWARVTTYVRNEPCAAVAITVQGDLVASDSEPDTCAVILTTATLKQGSAAGRATPEAFKIRELRTTGSARGTNRIISYVSLKTGLLVRATEEANQSMDVTVAKADGSNHVRYNIAAKSTSEVLLVSETPLTHP